MSLFKSVQAWKTSKNATHLENYILIVSVSILSKEQDGDSVWGGLAEAAFNWGEIGHCKPIMSYF